MPALLASLRRLAAAWTAKPGRFFAGAAAATVLVLGGDALVRTLAERRPGSAGGAAWIWADGVHRSGLPVGFFAVGEVELAEVPAGARLGIAVDEGYLVRVNGKWVGAASYRPGEALHVYAVADLLRPGRNRIVVEARSVRGAGALLATLDDDAGKSFLKTGEDWRIFRRAPDGLDDLAAKLPEGERPRLWGRDSVGRWRLPPLPQRRPRLAERRVLRAERGRLDEPGATWRRLRSKRRFPLRDQLFAVYDFGKPVTGYLTLRLDPDVVEPGLVAFSIEDPPGRFSPPSVVVVPVPGAGRWDDVAVRRFRYCFVAASGVVAPPQLRPVAPSRAAALSVTPPFPGVFGLPAPPATAPSIAFDIWSRLDGEAERTPPRSGRPERRRGTRPRDRGAASGAAEAAQSGATGSKGTT